MEPQESQTNTSSFDYHKLFYAVKSGNYKKVEQLLDQNSLKIDDNWIDYKLVIHAVKCHCHLSIVELLVNSGCRVKGPKTNQYKTPLYYAVEGNKTSVVKLLLKAGASICDKDVNIDTPMYLALKENYFDELDLMLSMYDIENIDSSSKDENIHFNIACMRNCENLVKNFIEKGIDVNAVQNWHLKKWSGFTPLHFAVENQSVDVVKILLKNGAQFTKQCKITFQSPLHLAFDSENTDTMNEIIDSILNYHSLNTLNPVDSKRVSHFHISCTRDNSALVKAFLKSGVDVNHSIILPKCTLGLSPLHLAVDFKKEANVKILLQHGANVNSVDDTESTALHTAVEDNNRGIIKILLEYNADVHLKNRRNFSPLYIAIQNKLYEVVKWFLRYGSDTNMDFLDWPSNQEIFDLMLSVDELRMTNDEQNFSILHVACMRNNLKLVEKLLQSNYDVNACVNWEAKKWPGFTPLHFAAYFYYYDLVKLLLQYKANVNLREINGYTPLWLAIKFRFDNEIANTLNEKFLKNKSSFEEAEGEEDEVMDFLFEEIKQLDIVHALVTHNSNLNAIDSCGRSLLFEACFPEVIWNISDDVVNKNFIKSICSRFCDINIKLNLKILIKHGINLKFTDESGVSILSHVANGHKSSNAYLHIDKKCFEHCQDTIMDLLTKSTQN